MISLKSKITKLVLGYFFVHEGEESYVNELARMFSLDSGNLARKLTELEKEGLLKSRWQGSERYYALNKDFSLYTEYKQIVLKTIGLEYTFLESLSKIAGVSRAVIFGSYAKDTMDASSDIDLLVVGDHDTIDLQKAMARIQKQIDRSINVVSMTDQEFKKKKKTDPLLKSIEKNKIIKVL